MMKFTVFFTVIAASIIIDRVNSLESINIQNFLQALQQQLKQEQKQQRKEQQKQVVYYPRDEDESYYGSLNKREVDRIISLLPREQIKPRSSKKNKQNKQQNEQYVLLRRPVSQDVKLVPDDLLGLDGKDDYYAPSDSDSGDQARQNEYSKVYVVLNSEAIKRSKNKDKLNALLSNLLASPLQEKHHSKRKRHQDRNEFHQLNRQLEYQARDKNQRASLYQKKVDKYPFADEYFLQENDGNQDRRDRDQDRRYKGFLINEDWLRRKMPRSNEEIERVEKQPILPNRSRDGGGGGGRDRPRRGRDHGGGGGGRGGGGGGHTAIPYIRQRGDIYEKDI